MAGFLGLRGLELRRRYRKTIRRLEAELHQLRSLPLSNDPVAIAAAAEDPMIASSGAPEAAASGQG